MAKAAKTIEPEITEKAATKFVADIFERREVVEEARNKARAIAHRERDAMNTLYEGMAARFGIPQKSSRLHIKIAVALQKIEGWVAELELNERKAADRLAKAAGDKRQLSLMLEVPKPKPEKAERKSKKSDPEQADIVEMAASSEAPLH